MKRSDLIKQGLRILTFDIETGAGVNGFKSDLASILCVGYKWAHESKPKCLSVLDYGRLPKKRVQDWDKELLMDFIDIVSEADIIVGHYSKMFDKKFINGRLMLHGLPPLPPVKHIDTCLEMRQLATFSSKRLKHLCNVLKLGNQKQENNWPEGWIEVTRNPKKYVGEMIPYCKGDVVATEELFFRMLPYMTRKGIQLHTKGSETCPKCSSNKIQKRGFLRLITGNYQRFQCQDCGAWSRSALVDNHIKDKVKDI